MSDIASLLTAGGLGSVLAGVVAGIFGWRIRSADYARIVTEMSRTIAADLRADNRELEAKVDTLQGSVDVLRARVIDLTEGLRAAIVRLDDAGYDTSVLRAVLHGRNGTTPGGSPPGGRVD